MAAIGKKYWTGCLASETNRATELTIAASAAPGAHKPSVFPSGRERRRGGEEMKTLPVSPFGSRRNHVNKCETISNGPRGACGGGIAPCRHRVLGSVQQ